MRSLAWVGILALGCSRGAPPGPSIQDGAWIEVDAHRPDVRAVVGREASAARARGLVPVLYLAANYTIASTQLQRLRTTDEMRRALEGIAVIRVEPILDGMAPYESLVKGYWHSFHAIDANGEPKGPALDPGTKDGPCADGIAATCAAWIRPFMRDLRAPAER